MGATYENTHQRTHFMNNTQKVIIFIYFFRFFLNVFIDSLKKYQNQGESHLDNRAKSF